MRRGSCKKKVLYLHIDCHVATLLAMTLFCDDLIHWGLIRVEFEDVFFTWQDFARVVSYVQHCCGAAVAN